MEQIATIGWTAIPMAKSNPNPGIIAIHSLRDLWARWLEPEPCSTSDADTLPVVYTDAVLDHLLDALVSLVVVSSESLQHQSMAALTATAPRVPGEQLRTLETMGRRKVSALGDHVLTRELDEALAGLDRALEERQRPTAAMIRQAREDLQRSLDSLLGSRATRVPDSSLRMGLPGREGTTGPLVSGGALRALAPVSLHGALTALPYGA